MERHRERQGIEVSNDKDRLCNYSTLTKAKNTNKQNKQTNKMSAHTDCIFMVDISLDTAATPCTFSVDRHIVTIIHTSNILHALNTPITCFVCAILIRLVLSIEHFEVVVLSLLCFVLFGSWSHHHGSQNIWREPVENLYLKVASKIFVTYIP
jgi:hypothetical protein